MQDHRDTIHRDERGQRDEPLMREQDISDKQDQRDGDERDDRDTAGEDLLPVEAAAALLGVTRRTVCRWVEAEKLPARRVRGKRGEELRVERAAVIAFRMLQPPLEEPARAPAAKLGQRDDQDQRDDRDNRDQDEQDNRDALAREAASLRARWEGAQLAARLHAARLGEEKERRREVEAVAREREAQFAAEIAFLRETLSRSQEAERELRILLAQTTRALSAQTERPALEAKNVTPRRRWWRWWTRG